MSQVLIRRAAEARTLVTLGSIVDLLGITNENEITQLERLVESVSSSVEDYTQRVFARELVTEQFGMDDLDVGDMNGASGPGHRIMLSRRPVLMIEAVRFRGTEVDLSTIQLESSDAGFLFSAGGFSPTNILYQQIEKVRTRFNEPVWEVDYSGGYVLPSFPDACDVEFTVDPVTNILTSASHILVNGDTLRFTVEGGALPAGLTSYRDYYVRDATDVGFQVSVVPNGPAVDITTTGSGTMKYSRRATLPPGLQGDVLQLLVGQFKSAKRDPSIISERLGDYTVQYPNPTQLTIVGAGTFPPAIQSRLDMYRDLVVGG